MTTNQNASVWPVAQRHGLIIGLISIIITVLMFVMGYGPADMQTGSLRWVVLLASLGITIFFMLQGIKDYRENHSDGYVSFGRAVKVAFFMVLVYAAITTIYNVVHTTIIAPDANVELMESIEEQWEEQGLTDEQIEQARGMTQMFMEQPLAGISQYIGQLFFGIILALIAAAIGKKERPDIIAALDDEVG